MRPRLRFLALLLPCSLFLSSCADPQTGQPTDHITGHISASGQAAIKSTATGIVALANLYDDLGMPGLNPSQAATFKACLNAGGTIVQAYVGQPLPTTSISTGSPAVNAAIVASIAPNTNVTQADANAVFLAAQIAGNPPLGCVLPSPPPK